MISKAKINGHEIEVHEGRFGSRRYWVKIDGLALFQRGRMRLRTFTTAEAALSAATKESR